MKVVKEGVARLNPFGNLTTPYTHATKRSMKMTLHFLLLTHARRTMQMGMSLERVHTSKTKEGIPMKRNQQKPCVKRGYPHEEKSTKTMCEE